MKYGRYVPIKSITIYACHDCLFGWGSTFPYWNLDKCPGCGGKNWYATRTIELTEEETKERELIMNG